MYSAVRRLSLPRIRRVSTDIRIKRALYRANQRGIRELDIIVGGWATRNLHKLNESELGEFEVLLDKEVPDLLAVFVNGKEPEGECSSIMRRIRRSVLEGDGGAATKV